MGLYFFVCGTANPIPLCVKSSVSTENLTNVDVSEVIINAEVDMTLFPLPKDAPDELVKVCGHYLMCFSTCLRYNPSTWSLMPNPNVSLMRAVVSAKHRAPIITAISV